MINLKTGLTISVLLFFKLSIVAQYNLKIEILNCPETHLKDTIFIAGNFNNWNPIDTKNILLNEQNIWSKEIKNIKAGVYEFKFTRGNWGKVACNANGKELNNYVIKLSCDTVLQFNIAGWKDDFPQYEKLHTESKNVHILDTAFFIPQLNAYRKIWIYLPENYSTSNQKYPVMYMHDGQNIFDEYTSGYGEWGIDECLDTLIKKGAPPCIVIGIDNNKDRMTEYNPYNHETYGNGNGDAYIKFIAETLKPFVDNHYRTFRDKENTIISGSSMGGIISYYAALQYPNVFGKAGVFSPAFWIAQKPFLDLTTNHSNNISGKLFFYIGELEGKTYVADMDTISNLLATNSTANICTIIDKMGSHNEKAWRKWFAQFYTFIMANGNNYMIKLED